MVRPGASYRTKDASGRECVNAHYESWRRLVVGKIRIGYERLRLRLAAAEIGLTPAPRLPHPAHTNRGSTSEKRTWSGPTIGP